MVSLPYGDSPSAFGERSIGDLFALATARYRDRIALGGRDESLTYGEIDHRVRRLAHCIAAQAPSGELVAVLVPNGPASVIASLACLIAGRTCLVLNADHPRDRNDEILRSAGVRVLVVGPQYDPASALVPDDAVVIDVDTNELGAEPAGRLSSVEPGFPAVVLYTSGSTGRPKGIVLSTRTILCRVGSNILSYGIGPQDRMLSLNGVGTIAGFTTMMGAFLAGATQHVLSAAEGSTRDLLARIERERITLLWSVPALMRMLLDTGQAGPALKHVRFLRLAGEPLLMSDLDRLRAALPPTCRIVNTYGQTEIPSIAEWIIPPEFSTDFATVPAGYRHATTECAILGDDGLPVAAGEVGELSVRSRYTASGEWEGGRCTAGRLLVDPDRPGWRMLHTGDLVRLRPDNLLEVVGRKDQQLKVRGQRLEPAEVESVLRCVPNVGDVAVVARRQSNGDATLIALIVPAGGADNSLLLRVRQAARAALPTFMQPARIITAERVPRLPGGKLDSLAVLALEAATPFETEAHGSDAEPSDTASASLRSRQVVARAWVRTLGRKSLDADATFDEAGGDSLRFMNLLFRIEEQLGTTLPLDAFHTELTASEIARAVDRCLAASSRPEPDGTACVFLVAGGGARDEPALARFRAACAPFRFELLDTGNWQEWVEHDLDLDWVIDRLVAQIEDRALVGPLLLAGYSLGGSLAFATALKLQNKEREVAFVGLLDSGLSPSGKSLDHWLRPVPKPSRFARFAADCRQQGTTAKILNTLSVVVARRIWALKGLRRVSNLLMVSETAIRFNRFVGSSVLVRAWCTWASDHRRAELDAPVFLFRAAEQAETASWDLGWGEHCPAFTVVSVPGGHHDLFDAQNLSALAQSFGRSVNHAVGKHGIGAGLARPVGFEHRGRLVQRHPAQPG